MLFLLTLGRVGLADDSGNEVEGLLRQPKRLALLAYLASPVPGTWHRRDILLGVFWPELDSTRARTALRNALHMLRRQIGDQVLRTRGDDEVSIDGEALHTDAALLEADVGAGRLTSAFARYQGEYLRGLYIREAEEFEHWLDGERRRLAAIARKTGLALADLQEREANLPAAMETLDRLIAIDTSDESVARRLITMLDRSGDRARALAVYERLRTRLADQFGAEPAPETVAQALALRRRTETFATQAPPPDQWRDEHATAADDPALGHHDTDLPSATPATVAPGTRDESLQQGASIDVVGASVDGSGESAPAVETRPLRSAQSPPAPRPNGHRGNVTRILVGLGILLLAAVAALVRHAAGAGTPTIRRLLVLRMENATGDSGLSYVAAGVADEVARMLRGIGGLEAVRSLARDDWARSAQSNIASLDTRFGAEVALRTRLTKRDDSLLVTGEAIDVRTGRIQSLGQFPFSVASARDVSSRLAASLAGTLFRAAIPQTPHATGAGRRQDGESFRLSMAGWYQLLDLGQRAAAKTLFLDALTKDATNARAWAGLSSVWTSEATIWDVEWSVGAAQGLAAGEHALALDSLEGTPWANVGFLRALQSHRLADGLPLIEKAIALDPSNPEIYIIESSLYRHAWQWDKALDAARIARQLDPLTPLGADRMAVIMLCTDRPEEGLRLEREALAIDSSYIRARSNAARALARLHRWDEALTEVRIIERQRGDSVSSARAPNDSAAFWREWERFWRAEMNLLQAKAAKTWVAPGRLAVTYVAAGQLELGLSMIETDAQSGDPGLYRLPCQAQVEHIRDWPRFRAMLQHLPAWR